MILAMDSEIDMTSDKMPRQADHSDVRGAIPFIQVERLHLVFAGVLRPRFQHDWFFIHTHPTAKSRIRETFSTGSPGLLRPCSTNGPASLSVNVYS